MKNKIDYFKEFIKNIDLLTIFMLVLMGFIAMIFVYTQYVSSSEKKYTAYYNNLIKIKIINKDFDSFVSSQRKLINLDSIAKEIKQFQDTIVLLKNSNIYESYGAELKENLIEVERLFFKKRNLLEKFKSYNASSLYSISYIMSLSDAIKRDKIFSEQKVYVDELLDSSLSDLFRIYLNMQINTSSLDNNILELEKLKKQTKELVAFQLNIKSAKKILKKIENIKIKVSKIELEKDILLLSNELDIKHRKIQKREEQIATYMSVSVFMLLAILMYVYTTSIKNKKELMSFRYAVENSDDTIVITDVDRRITYVNDAFAKNTGYTKKEALGQNPSILKSGDLPEEFYINLNSILDKGQKWCGDFINKTKNGEIYYEKSSITPMFLNNKLTGYLAIKLNITEYIKEQKKTEFLAYHDSLTLLPNRRQMKKTISEELKNIETNGNKLSLLFLDLDGFKNVNDTLGHDVGDLLLCDISNKLVKYSKKENSVFRTGGDEFAILLCTSIDDSEKIAKDILNTINEQICINEHVLRIGASIGIARYTNTKENLISLLKHADIAMYEAKQNGKNRYKYYTKNMSNAINKKMITEQALSTALENGEFYVVYQPKYSLETREIVSMEALIRWKNSDLGVVPPDYFIPIAENMNVINAIGEFVFTKACEDFMQINKISNAIQKVSINVSLSQLIEKNLLDTFKNIVETTGMSSHNIGIEVTETHIMHDIEENIKTLNAMRDYGFSVILDDFGTGYSSMSYLKKLPINNLKIDKSFIDNICTDKSDLEIVKATIAISKSFNYGIVAEGIETKEQEALLFNMGVEFGQGYFFSKPKTKENLIKFIKSKEVVA